MGITLSLEDVAKSENWALKEVFESIGSTWEYS